MSLISPYEDIAMFTVPKGAVSKRKPAPRHVIRSADRIKWHKVDRNTYTGAAANHLQATVYKMQGAWQVGLRFHGKAKPYPLRDGNLAARFPSFTEAARAAYEAMNTSALIEAAD